MALADLIWLQNVLALDVATQTTSKIELLQRFQVRQ